MILYSRYNSNRKKEFRLITTIENINSNIHSNKIAENNESIKFLNGVYENYEILSNNSIPFNLAVPRKIKLNKIRFEYIAGDSLEYKIFKNIQQNDRKNFKRLIMDYAYYLNRFELTDFSTSSDFKKIFGNVKINKKSKCAQVGCIDLNFDNIIISGSEKYLIDYEWVIKSPLPVNYIIFRALYALYGRFYKYKPNNIIRFSKILNELNIKKSEINIYSKMENSFQNFVNNISQNYKKFKKYYNKIENN